MRTIRAFRRLAAGWITLVTAWGAVSATVQTDHFTYYPQEPIQVSFSGGPGNPKDWIGVYPNGEVPDGDPASTVWQYADGAGGVTGLAEGAVTFAGGLNLAGDWDVHLLLNDGYTSLASNLFRVVDPFTPLVRSPQRTYGAGEAFEITFTNGPGNAKDWVAVYPVGEVPDGDPESTVWQYVDGTTSGTVGATSGTLSFAGGISTPGEYTIHLLMDDGYVVLASEPLTIVAPSSSFPRVLSVSPADGTSNRPPAVVFTASITNGSVQVATNTVVLRYDGVAVTPAIAEQAGLVTVSYGVPGLAAAGSTHTFELTFDDNASPANHYTNQVTFTIAQYRSLVLPAPLYLETFDQVPEGQLPAGWTGESFTEVQNMDEDLGNLDSATYGRWTVVNADRFTGSFVTYSNPDNPEGWETDYHRVLTINPLNVVNGAVVRDLAMGRLLFGNSGYRSGASQVLYVTTPDYDLSGKTNIHLSFHSLWEQNQDSLGAVEYSVDRGQTWLPVVYLLASGDVLTQTNETSGEVTVDAVATFTTEYGDVARYFDNQGVEHGGSYGAFIAAPVTAALADFISPRVDDDPAESKRVEYFRLTQADNQSTVRFCIAHAGTDSWYFGIDDFGLYSIPVDSAPPQIQNVSLAGSQVVITWTGATGVRMQRSPTLENPDWQDVPNTGGASTLVVPATGASGYFRLVR